MTTKSIILLSGGLDSAVSLGLNKNEDNIQLALFFDYGQRALTQELAAVKNLCEYYNIELETINLAWLKNITQTSLVDKNNSVPSLSPKDLNNPQTTLTSMKNVWIPNRNSLFLNIAGCYADSYGYDKIIIGANKEEAATFSDNSEDFIKGVTNCFQFSTLQHPTVIAPLIHLTKKEIIQAASEISVPFNLIWSCYNNNQRHCGKCESCLRLKTGLESAGLFDIVKLLFDN